MTETWKQLSSHVSDYVPKIGWKQSASSNTDDRSRDTSFWVVYPALKDCLCNESSARLLLTWLQKLFSLSFRVADMFWWIEHLLLLWGACRSLKKMCSAAVHLPSWCSFLIAKPFFRPRSNFIFHRELWQQNFPLMAHNFARRYFEETELRVYYFLGAFFHHKKQLSLSKTQNRNFFSAAFTFIFVSHWLYLLSRFVFACVFLCPKTADATRCAELTVLWFVADRSR